VLDGDPAPPPLLRHCSQFSANVRCGRTTEWTKMPLGMDGGLGLGDFVFDEDPAPPEKRAQPPHPIFGPCLLWPNGWMDQGACTWYENRPRPRPHCVRLGPISSPCKRAQQPPSFGPCLLWPRSTISVTAELSFYDRDSLTDRPTEKLSLIKY